MKYCFGVDIGGTFVKLGLFTTEGELLDKWQIPTRREDNSSHVLPDIAAALKGKLEEKGISIDDVTGVGFGTPGPVTDDGVSVCPANLDWVNKPVAKELSELMGVPSKGGNDVNVAGLGEMWRGGARGYKNVVVVPIGTGVGAAIIVNGKVITGTRGAAGEVGHIHVDDEIQEPCGCKAVGCVEQFSSATGLVRMAKKALAEGRETSLSTLEEVTAKDVIDAAKAGDAVADEIFDKFCNYLGYSLAATAAVIDPEIFIIGGGVSKAGQVLVDRVQSYFVKYAWPGIRGIKFALAELGNDAGIYGAASMVIG
ncbi:MAG: ROK family glucokinase [Lachnospiraceae bacterium]|nr:ROK family glucokinase [Lachnospiraceae bacterium]